MKIDRLLSIIIILLNKGKISAKELSDRFEVSVRTIYRDIDTINMSGIPVVSQQGNTGGFSILENYKIDRQLLSFQDIVSIISALKSVNNAFKDKKIENTLEKITSLVQRDKKQKFLEKNNEIIFDKFPLYCSKKIQENCKIIYDMIQLKKIISITYINQKIKEIESKNDFFIKKSANYQDYTDKNFGIDKKVKFVIKFSANIKNKILEYYSDEELQYLGDGSAIVTLNCPDDDWFYSFILGFGSDAEIIEPEHAKKIITEKAKKTVKIYKPDIMLS